MAAFQLCIAFLAVHDIRLAHPEHGPGRRVGQAVAIQFELAVIDLHMHGGLPDQQDNREVVIPFSRVERTSSSRNIGRSNGFYRKSRGDTDMQKFLPALAVMALVSTGAMAQDKASQKFITAAIEGNYAEVKMGELAQNNGQ